MKHIWTINGFLAHFSVNGFLLYVGESSIMYVCVRENIRKNCGRRAIIVCLVNHWILCKYLIIITPLLFRGCGTSFSHNCTLNIS